ncbi:hypothetical protein IW262DRAFT_1261225 [Armillaria fumosa]|nr:hypothetical protein IW262DRAFT_1261225 [Armillaria fumosa]
MTSAYAFTHYRSPGQTIPVVIVDVARPPAGKLSLFNLYVALSQKLLMEDDRLDALDKGTQLWWGKMKSSSTEA